MSSRALTVCVCTVCVYVYEAGEGACTHHVLTETRRGCWVLGTGVADCCNSLVSVGI